MRVGDGRGLENFIHSGEGQLRLETLKNLKCRIPIIRLSILIRYPLLISALIGILSVYLSAAPYNMAETT